MPSANENPARPHVTRHESLWRPGPYGYRAHLTLEPLVSDLFLWKCGSSVPAQCCSSHLSTRGTCFSHTASERQQWDPLLHKPLKPTTSWDGARRPCASRPTSRVLRHLQMLLPCSTSSPPKSGLAQQRRQDGLWQMPRRALWFGLSCRKLELALQNKAALQRFASGRVMPSTQTSCY